MHDGLDRVESAASVVFLCTSGYELLNGSNYSVVSSLMKHKQSGGRWGKEKEIDIMLGV